MHIFEYYKIFLSPVSPPLCSRLPVVSPSLSISPRVFARQSRRISNTAQNQTSSLSIVQSAKKIPPTIITWLHEAENHCALHGLSKQACSPDGLSFSLQFDSATILKLLSSIEYATQTNDLNCFPQSHSAEHYEKRMEELDIVKEKTVDGISRSTYLWPGSWEPASVTLFVVGAISYGIWFGGFVAECLLLRSGGAEYSTGLGACAAAFRTLYPRIEESVKRIC